VALQRGAQTFVGSAAFCTRPATIDAAVVAAATPEWREMQRDGVQDGSARHALLKSRMHERIVAACKRVAQAEGCDLVVRSGDIADNRGLPVVDLTAPLLRGL
jgi:Skp family chaperone for outer membrane proteins